MDIRSSKTNTVVFSLAARSGKKAYPSNFGSDANESLPTILPGASVKLVGTSAGTQCAINFDDNSIKPYTAMHKSDWQNDWYHRPPTRLVVLHDLDNGTKGNYDNVTVNGTKVPSVYMNSLGPSGVIAISRKHPKTRMRSMNLFPPTLF